MGVPHDRVDCKAEKASPTQGQIQKSQKGGRGVPSSHKGTIYFTENSFKIMQNFTVKEGGRGWYPLDL